MGGIGVKVHTHGGRKLHFLEADGLTYDTAFVRLEMAQQAMRRIEDNGLLESLVKQGRFADNPEITVFEQ